MVAVFLVTALAGCAVRGYELGWRHDDGFVDLFGEPLDALSGCRWSADKAPDAPPVCLDLAAALDGALAAGPGDGLDTLRCQGDVCSYRNVYERRDAGLALVVPVWRKVTVRDVRARIERSDGVWRLTELVVADPAPPTYGPVRVGG